MSIELDHVFLLTDPSAPLADLLIDAGLVEGSSNIHPGQGTANRRFFFSNTTLEFLYVHDSSEAANGPARRLQFNERSLADDASPFGLVMRTAAGDAEIPFDGWKYCPDYFADDMCFFVASNSDDIKEPLCICMPDNLPQRKEAPAPENPDWKLTELRMSVPLPTPSTPLQNIARCKNIEIEFNKPHCLSLTFNEGRERAVKDFTPSLPLIMRW